MPDPIEVTKLGASGTIADVSKEVRQGEAPLGGVQMAINLRGGKTSNYSTVVKADCTQLTNAAITDALALKKAGLPSEVGKQMEAAAMKANDLINRTIGEFSAEPTVKVTDIRDVKSADVAKACTTVNNAKDTASKQRQ